MGPHSSTFSRLRSSTDLVWRLQFKLAYSWLTDAKHCTRSATIITTLSQITSFCAQRTNQTWRARRLFSLTSGSREGSEMNLISTSRWRLMCPSKEIWCFSPKTHSKSWRCREETTCSVWLTWCAIFSIKEWTGCRNLMMIRPSTIKCRKLNCKWTPSTFVQNMLKCWRLLYKKFTASSSQMSLIIRN